jgi:GH24 family phage-related lysozyme (muramidase)
MKPSVRDAFTSFSERFEGSVPHLYLDIKQIPTIAIGNAVFNPFQALRLPLVRNADGEPASDLEIIQEWRRLAPKVPPSTAPGQPPGDQDPAVSAEIARLGHRAAKPYTRLHLRPEGIAQVVTNKLLLDEVELKRRFPEFESWPADAQLATFSMAWACGPAFKFPRLAAALRAKDFRAAALECHIEDSHNPGIRPRNAANVALYENAARVLEEGLDGSRLYFPGVPQ